MTAPPPRGDIDDAIERYLAGEPWKKIQAATGVSVTTFHRERTRRGIPPRRELILDVQALASAYRAGVSEYALAAQFKVSRPVIRRRLRAAGIPIRGRSEAGFMRAAAMTPNERATQARAAHAGKRGRTPNENSLETAALTRERNGKPGSRGEILLSTMLGERGLASVPQKAIGRYNVDLAVAPIAVEVLGGGWHARKTVHARRIPYILDAGWHLLLIWNHEGSSALGPGAADYLITWHEEACRQPASRREYRVIGGGGNLLACGSADSDQFALVPPPRGRQRGRA